MVQIQKHGFIWENDMRRGLNLEPVQNDTNKHDIVYLDENISVKCAKSDQNGNITICCGDVLRFYDLDPNTKIFLVIFKQHGVKKRVYECMEINYTKSLHDHFFNGISRDILEEYVNNVKSIPTKVTGYKAKAIFPYLTKKKRN